ncbi:uncharacterized protein DMAD_11567 [Drosophila madeirensis]|uniref:Uncharacterized protein n=1 Tax=Drosophila madeirensis TaxID=30013 RepID=A0AAU9FDJ3_DROMD
MHFTKQTLLLLVLTISLGCVLANPKPQLLSALLGDGGVGGVVQPLVDGAIGAVQGTLPIVDDVLGTADDALPLVGGLLGSLGK